MGIGLIWQNSVVLALADMGINAETFFQDEYELLRCNESLVVHLIPIDHHFNPEDLIALQSAYQAKGINLVQLWEDIWHTRRPQVLGRITSLLGLNKKLHGRKAVVRVIDQEQAAAFLNDNHIQGTARSKYKFALEIAGEIVAVACFSAVRLMTRTAADYRSAELIRFASLSGFTVTGGFTKLLKYFIAVVGPDDIMSYADRDWSLGNAYERSGFTLAGVTPPAQIWLERKELTRFFPHRLPVSLDQNADAEALPEHAAAPDDRFVPIFNTGNLKYKLYLGRENVPTLPIVP